MDWYKKLHPNERAEQALEQILKRTGIGEQISREIEDERSQRFAKLQSQKAAAHTQFLRDKATAEAKVADELAKELDARKVAEAALQSCIRAQNAVSNVIGNYGAIAQGIDREMLTCCDPQIDTFIAELSGLLDQCQYLIRDRVDGKGKVVGDNRAQVDRRVHKILELQSVVVPNLKTDCRVENIGAEIERLRMSIPEVRS